MMTMTRLSIAIALALPLAACSNDEQPTENEPTPKSAENSEPPREPEPPREDAPQPKVTGELNVDSKEGVQGSLNLKVEN